ncbi:putative GTPase or GTP-binding protein [Geoglobus ahangari]|uniref:polynucleotide 5'-hydroxyl-kinase n=1 Tax=Geoglobus ahangari TaxID=113653 RepID=A0A0F7IFW3_9EURY|nr:Clp1/GlmU family protein [Geoglobus ahangari]AKG90763.1 putative GTPase or GTP-binding protein [Geoglobus ahangari]
MRVEGNTTLLLIGPGKLRSSEPAKVFGASVREAEVPEGKVYPFFFQNDAEVQVEGTYILVNGDTTPESWKRFAERGYERVFTFGDTDSGKSSFCVYLLNSTEIGRAIDADVGQSDVAHPGAMGLGEARGNVFSLSQLKIVDVAFVGVISPSGFESRCLRGFSHLAKLAVDRAVVDTTGWIRGRRAREYKLAKIEIFEPDVIACFGDVPDYLSDYETARLDSFVVKKRDREMRVAIRGRRYEEWFRGLEEVEVDVDRVRLRNTTMFSGTPVSDDVLESFGEVLYAERGFDFLTIYSRSFDAGVEAIRFLREYFGVAEVNVVNPDELTGLILGLRRGGKYLSPGKLLDVDLEGRKIKILGRRDAEIIEFGNFRLDEERREVLVRVP